MFVEERQMIAKIKYEILLIRFLFLLCKGLHCLSDINKKKIFGKQMSLANLPNSL
jgi:hypothetical protein